MVIILLGIIMNANMSPTQFNSIPNNPICQMHGSIPTESKVIMLNMMHYITNINKSNSPGQLPLIRTILKIWKETNNFFPLNCSIHCGRTLYTKCNNVTTCMYEVFLYMQHSTEKFILILYNENKHKLIKWLMQKCMSWQWVNITTSGSI